MQFTIERADENGLSIIRLKDKENGTTVSILPEHGALLHEFVVMLSGEPFNVVENYNDRKTLLEELDTSYKNTKLSPFVCRIRDGRYNFNGQDLEITKKYSDGSAIHGLVFDRPFDVTEQFVNEQNACVAVRYDYNNDDPGYPYQFSCTLTYTLLPNSVLQLTTIIENTDDKDIPLSDGWHPYFRLGGNISGWILQFPASKKLEFDEGLIPTGNFDEDDTFLTPREIGDRKIDNCYLLERPDRNQPVCSLSNPANKLSVTVFADEGYQYLQVFTSVNRESVAIENLSSAPDCFNNRMGLLVLKPGEAQRFQARYKIEVPAD